MNVRSVNFSVEIMRDLQKLTIGAHDGSWSTVRRLESVLFGILNEFSMKLINLQEPLPTELGAMNALNSGFETAIDHSISKQCACLDSAFIVDIPSRHIVRHFVRRSVRHSVSRFC